MRRRGDALAWLTGGALLVAALWGCNPVTRHKVLSTVFDGVPSLPPPEELCAEYAQAPLAAAPAVAAAAAAPRQGSQHLPYKAKKCKACHNTETSSGLTTPVPQLCYDCHSGFVLGAYVHGPVAVGDCLACHDPHSSANPSLLDAPRAQLCATCHREARLALQMHERVAAKGLDCLDCHNPHAGSGPFFTQ